MDSDGFNGVAIFLVLAVVTGIIGYLAMLQFKVKKQIEESRRERERESADLTALGAALVPPPSIPPPDVAPGAIPDITPSSLPMITPGGTPPPEPGGTHHPNIIVLPPPDAGGGDSGAGQHGGHH